jgi:MYXO-CTERM domain-containing protein
MKSMKTSHMLRNTNRVALSLAVAVAAVVSVNEAVAFTGLTFFTSSLSLTPTSILDIESNSFVLQASPNDAPTQAVNLANITTWVTSGFNGGDYLGNGIRSSSSLTEPSGLGTVGFADNSLLSLATWQSVSLDVGLNQVLVKYTYFGDANLDGVVDSNDYGFIDTGFADETSGDTLDGWLLGDFNYDGFTDSNDYGYIDTAFALPAIVPLSIAGGAPKSGVVPEPGTAALAAVGLVGLLVRRRRNS